MTVSTGGGLRGSGTSRGSSLAANMPPELAQLGGAGGSAVGKLDSPQVLLSEQARTQLAAVFDKMGPQGAGLLEKFMDAVRHSLQASISDLFFLATIIRVAGLAVVFFLREDPLRRTHTLVVPVAKE